MTLKTRLVRIGNSRGVRIPKPLLEQSGIRGPVELEARDGQIVIHAARSPREGWDEAFAAMAEAGDDALLAPETPTDWDDAEWVWE